MIRYYFSNLLIPFGIPQVLLALKCFYISIWRGKKPEIQSLNLYEEANNIKMRETVVHGM